MAVRTIAVLLFAALMFLALTGCAAKVTLLGTWAFTKSYGSGKTASTLTIEYLFKPDQTYLMSTFVRGTFGHTSSYQQGIYTSYGNILTLTPSGVYSNGAASNSVRSYSSPTFTDFQKATGMPVKYAYDFSRNQLILTDIPTPASSPETGGDGADKPSRVVYRRIK